MKNKIILAFFVSLNLNHVYADDNDNFFVAYSASQSSKTSDILKKKMMSLTSIDKIVVMTLKRIGQDTLAAEYFNRADLQIKLRKVVLNYLNSNSANQIFDDESTKLFNKTYSLTELQAIYQLNTSENGKAFIEKSLKIDTVTQNYMDEALKQNFDKVSFDQLETDVENVFKALSIERVKTEQNVVVEPEGSTTVSVRTITRSAEPTVQEKSIPIVGRLKNEAVIPVAEHVQESIKEEIKSTVENAESNVSSSVSMKIITRPTVQANQTVVVAQVPTVEVPKTEPSIPVVETLPKVEEGIQ